MVEPGVFEIMFGASAEDIKIGQSVYVEFICIKH
jgi:hypothetical protein